MRPQESHVVIIAAGCSRRLQHLTRDFPKSFLPIHGKRIIDYHLDILDQRGFRQVTIVVGYLRQLFIDTIGNQHGGLQIDYVVADEFETTGHGWSVFLTRDRWLESRRPVLLVHADVFYDPCALDALLDSPYPNTLAVDADYAVQTGDECVVRGERNQVESVTFDSDKNRKSIIGESIGLSCWGPRFVEDFYGYLENTFVTAGREEGYERILNRFIHETPAVLNYVAIEKCTWVNINYVEDYESAQNEHYDSIYSP